MLLPGYIQMDISIVKWKRHSFILGSLSNLSWVNEFTVSAQSQQLCGFSQQQKHAGATYCVLGCGCNCICHQFWVCAWPNVMDQLTWELVFAFSAWWVGALTEFSSKRSCNEKSGLVFLFSQPSQHTGSWSAVTPLGHSQYPEKENTHSLFPFCGRLWSMCLRCKVLAKTR